MRSLKSAPIAFLVVIALALTGAGAAQASAVYVSAGSTTYTGTQTGGGHTFALPGSRTLSCSSATLKGSISNGSEWFLAGPSYSGCITKVGETALPATVEFGICSYEFRVGSKSGWEEAWSLPMHFWCSEGELAIRLYVSAATHKAGEVLCEYRVAPQTNLAGFTGRNDAGNLRIKGVEVSIAYQRIKGTVGNCGGATGNLKFNGESLLAPASGVLAFY